MSNINGFESENNYGNGGFAPGACNNDKQVSENDSISNIGNTNAGTPGSVSTPVNAVQPEASEAKNLHISELPDASDRSFESASDDFSAPDIPQKTAPSENVYSTLSNEVPQNIYGTYSSHPAAHNAGQNSYSSCPRPVGETAGIRYDADKTSADGNYTWQYCQNGQPTQMPSKKSEHKALKVVSVTLAAILAAGIIGFGIYFATNGLRPGDAPSAFGNDGEKENYAERLPDNSGGSSHSGKGELPVILPKDEQMPSDTQTVVVNPAEDGTLSKQMIAVKCKPSSVGIEVTATTRSYFGNYKTSGVGSGFILTQDGYIATNNHVIEGAEEITVMLDDGTKHEAKIIGADSVTDLAVIKIEAEGLIPMEIGDSDVMKVGDSVIAIGTPAGIEFAGTVTDGIVSAVNRPVEVQGSNGYTKTMTLMQTNAAINPGNSGGPLINNKGEVIGINTLKLTEEYEGIGFSIPINSAITIFNQLIKDGKVTDYEQSFVTGTGAIGITNYFEVTEEESKYYGIPVGIMVVQLKPGSSAQAAGLKRGDIITGFNGQKVTTVEEINELKSSFKAGDEVTLTVYRDPTEITDITFKLDVMG